MHGMENSQTSKSSPVLVAKRSWRISAKLVHGLALTLGYLVLGLFAYSVFEAGCMWADEKVRQRNVRELAHLPFVPEPETLANQPRDFDGDGVLDELSVEYERVEPFFNWVSSGMVYLQSAKTGETIMTHRLNAPFFGGGWYGDYDGDGLCDVVLKTRDGWTVFGFDGEGR